MVHFYHLLILRDIGEMKHKHLSMNSKLKNYKKPLMRYFGMMYSVDILAVLTHGEICMTTALHLLINKQLITD